MSIQVLAIASRLIEKGYSREQSLVSAWVQIEQERIDELIKNTLGEE